MIIKRAIFRAVLPVLASGLLIQLAVAQTQRSGGDSGARAMQQLQQMAAERARLQQQNEEMKQKLDDAKKKLEQASAERARTESRAKAAEVAAAKEQQDQKFAAETLEKNRAQLQELIGKYREMVALLQNVESDRDQTKGQLAVREREFKTCVDRNAGLYFLNDEILTRLEHQGLWSAIKDKEAFTSLSRTRLENLVDDYRDRVEELRIKRSSATASAAK